MISLKQIRYILAVERTLNFKRAAERCAISQSALSSAVAEMERQLGFQIFERDNKKVLLTALGRRCLDQAREIKLRVDDLEALGASLKRPLSHPMSLGVIPTIGPYLLPRVLPEVRRRYPQFKLRIYEEQSRQLVEMVRQGDLDTAILALPYATDGLLAFEFWQENFHWICHRDDSWIPPEKITQEALKASRLMLLSDGHCLKDHALAACRLRSGGTDDSLASTSLNTLIQMVAGRMGTTLVPEMALPQLLGSNRELKSIPLEEPGPHRRIAFITRPNYTNLPQVELLMELFAGQLHARVTMQQEPEAVSPWEMTLS
ncbi:MAG: LysR family transcriptional regulator [Gammaproteobacteria bacterium]|nr:LysR family transcriptional regulator [Gammaproteobacteria bacterium]